MLTLLAAVPEPTQFDVIVGVVIPVIVGAISIMVAGVALVVAIGANNQSKAANTTAQAALRIAERQDAREERMPRERVAHSAILVLNDAMHRRWEPDDQFELRVLPVTNALVQCAGEEGIEQPSVQPLVRWLIREAAAVANLLPRYADEIGRYKPGWTMGMYALRMSFGVRADEWVRTGMIDSDATVVDEQAELLAPLTP